MLVQHCHTSAHLDAPNQRVSLVAKLVRAPLTHVWTIGLKPQIKMADSDGDPIASSTQLECSAVLQCRLP